MMGVFWLFAALVFIFGFVVFRGAPYVPSLRREVKKAFDELYTPGPKDTVVDVGSGDGVILRLVAARGARAVGYELNPVLVLISRLLSRGDTRVRVQLRDFWTVRLPRETTLVYAFTVSRDIDKLAAKLQQEANSWGRPLHFISYGSTIAGKQPLKKAGAHHLYRFDPLQQQKA